jgi:hypothetical protein
MEPRRTPFPFACFTCRTSFKKEIVLYELEKHWEINKPKKGSKCPSCGGPTYFMGIHFKAPKKTDIQQWKKVELLIQAGFDFQTKENPWGPFPKSLRETPDFIERNQKRLFEIHKGKNEMGNRYEKN